MMKPAHADRTLIFITALSARLTCPKPKPDLSGARAKRRIGTAKFLRFYYFFITHEQRATATGSVLTLQTGACFIGCTLPRAMPKPSSLAPITACLRPVSNPVWTSSVTVSADGSSVRAYSSVRPWLYRAPAWLSKSDNHIKIILFRRIGTFLLKRPHILDTISRVIYNTK